MLRLSFRATRGVPIGFVAALATLVGCTASTAGPISQGTAAATTAPDPSVNALVLWEGGSARDPEGAANDEIEQGNQCFAQAKARLVDATRDPEVRRLAHEVMIRKGGEHLDLIYWVRKTHDAGFFTTSYAVEPSLTLDLWKAGTMDGDAVQLQVDQHSTPLGSAPLDGPYSGGETAMADLLEKGSCDISRQQVIDLLGAF